MSNTNRTSINQLAQQYADGELDRARYLELRTETLEKLVTDRTNREKPAVSDKFTPPETKPTLREPGISQPEKPEPIPQDSIPFIRIAIVAFILLLSFILGIYLFFMI
ncbi:hypothetical protein L3Q72_05955 [Vibrio sp. JC009]|uniref:hypothetical protein n=1 Tax=Vibrio sp. JC009 TaxID=2912314 RepID=UPI0023B1C780|nr:hypothetical protein [Vibrio sp. JC009]WED22935.1 hypothetical protein L3Q72_05955 [Vibrio sp. JC009]